MHLTLVILAAGLGNRFGGLKQLEAVGPGGATIMDYSVYDAWQAGFRKVVFVIRPEMRAACQTALTQRYAGRLAVAFAHQALGDLPDGFRLPADCERETGTGSAGARFQQTNRRRHEASPGVSQPLGERSKPWGTGQAVLAAESCVDGPFAVCNADDFYGASSFATLAAFLNSPPLTHAPAFAVVTYTLRATLPDRGAVARAVCQSTGDGWLSDIAEVTGIEKCGARICVAEADSTGRSLGGNEQVSMNLWGFTPRVFDLLRDEFRIFLREHGQSPSAEFYLPAAISAALPGGGARVKLLPSQETWCGITHPQDRGRVVHHLRALTDAGVYPERLEP